MKKPYLSLKIFLSVILILSSFSNSFSQKLNDEDKNAIISVLHHQEEKWNAGDIPGYMEGYYHSDSLKFITKKGITYGWQNTLEKYKKSYPDKETMGMLHFDVISIEALCNEKAILTGKWTLIQTDKNNSKNTIGGFFTLIWQQFDGKWKIITDHTS